MTTLTREEAIDAVSEAMFDIREVDPAFWDFARAAIMRLEELGVVFPVGPEATAYTARRLKAECVRIAALIGGKAEVVSVVSSSRWSPPSGDIAVYPHGVTASGARMSFPGPFAESLASAEHYARSFCEYPPATTADDLGVSA